MRSIQDLPDLETIAAASGVEGFSDDFAELFALDDALVRAGGRRVVVFRNADIRAIALNPAAGNMPMEIISKRAYLDAKGASPIADEDRNHIARLLFNQVFTVNDPLHGPTRQVFAKPFMPKFMPRFAEIANRTVPDLIDEVAGRGEIDFGFQFTEKLTARFWGDVFGMTADEETRVVEIVRAMTPFFFMERTKDETLAANEAAGEYLELMSGAVDRTLASGDNTLVNSMAAEFDAIDLEGKPEGIGLAIASNLIDGFHTAALAAANAVYHLLKNPDALKAVQDNPALAVNALGEGLRLSPPVIVTHRFALEDFDYAGVAIPKGTALAMLWSAGNRDPAVFDEPNTYQLMRRQRLDSTFGGGAHICPGRNVARVIVEAVVKGVTAPGVEIELAGEVRWIARSSMRQPYHMPVKIRRL